MRLWRLHPKALHVCNQENLTAFDLALRSSVSGMERAVGLFQFQLSVEELLESFRSADMISRVRPLIEQQCESLPTLLTRDLVTIVQDYLGLPRQHAPANKGRW